MNIDFINRSKAICAYVFIGLQQIYIISSLIKKLFFEIAFYSFIALLRHSSVQVLLFFPNDS
jgi:hypothetical protein